MAAVGYFGRSVDIKISFFMDMPLRRQSAPETKILIPVDQPLEYFSFDLAAGAIGRQNRIENGRIANRRVDILAQAVRVAFGLLFIGGNPEIGLQQDQGDYYQEKRGWIFHEVFYDGNNNEP